MGDSTQPRRRVIAPLVSIGVALGGAAFAISLATAPAESVGSGTPEDCHVGNSVQASPGEIVTYDAGSQSISAVCIKSGDKMFVTATSSGHSGPLGNGVHENGCYSVAGVGTSFVTVERIGASGSTCQSIGHVDVLLGAIPPPPPTATATNSAVPTNTATTVPTATASATPSPTATGTVTPTASATTTPTPQPTNTPVPDAAPAVATNTATPTRTPTATPTSTPVPPTIAPSLPPPSSTATRTPVSAVLGQVSTPVPTRTPSPTPNPSNTPTVVPTSTLVPPTRTPTPQGPPSPAEGFKRITLLPGFGFAFGPEVIAATGVDVAWDGTELTVGNGARFTAPFAATSAGEIGAPPAGGYDRTSFTPQPGTAVHILVPSASGDQIFTLWIPPGQQLAGGSSPLLLDWRLAGANPPPAVGGAFPKAFEEINLAGDLFAGGAGVAATNLMVTVAILLLLLAGGAVFNEALEENVRGWGVRTVRVPGALGGMFSRLRGALLGVGAAWAALIPGRSWLDHAIGPAALLLGTGLIYSLLEPGFGWNEASFTLFVSLVISQGVLVVFYEGGKAWLYRRNLRVDAGLRLFPACILIALVSVAISRAADFQPGFVIGFIAAAVVLGAPDFSAKERGRAWAQVAAAMLAVSILAWLAAIPLHELYEASPSVWTSLPEATALAIFVVCLQGLLFNLIPLEFMDGWRIFKWNPLAWLALFVPSAFLFTQILFNDDDAYLDLIASQKSVTGALVLVGYLGVTFGTWAFLRWRVENKDADPAVPATGDAGG